MTLLNIFLSRDVLVLLITWYEIIYIFKRSQNDYNDEVKTLKKINLIKKIKLNIIIKILTKKIHS